MWITTEEELMYQAMQRSKNIYLILSAKADERASRPVSVKHTKVFLVYFPEIWYYITVK